MNEKEARINLDFTLSRESRHEPSVVKRRAPAITPMNMRDGSLIVRGKGNPEWNFSSPHGAGRLMSRSKAKESLSVDEFRQSMDGIFTTCVGKSTIDESPMAYKPMDEIIRNIQDTAEVVKIIKV